MSAVIADVPDGIDLDNISLIALSPSTRNFLSSLLNIEKLIPTEDRLLRDWRGLAQLVGKSPVNAKDPTDGVISAWITLASDEPRPTIGNLLIFLQKIDRWDVHDDIIDRVVEDAQNFSRKTDILPSSNEQEVITTDDLGRQYQGLPLQTYDAVFLYVDEDAAFAGDIVSILEGEFGMRLCLRDRDLVGGLIFEHDAIMRLISYRCSQLIVIISEHFINSKEHRFFFKYAQALSIHLGERKIIPCVRSARGLEVPHEFKFYFLLDFSRHSDMRSFCVRLKQSLKPEIVTPALPAPPVYRNVREESEEIRCTIEEVSSEVHSRLSLSSSPSEVHTQVVQMPDPASFLSPEKNKSNTEVSVESSSARSKSESKPSVSRTLIPSVKLRNMLWSKKSTPSETTSNGTAQPKPKKGKSWKLKSKKRVAVAES